jgi:uncharacterized spore protein YtfJ
VTRSRDSAGADPLAPRILAVRKLLARISGARLCYGEPIKANGRTIIPVAKMSSAGGGGFGSNDGVAADDLAAPGDGVSGSSEIVPSPAGIAARAGSPSLGGVGSGGGGGGTLSATPIGFIEVSDAGSRFEAIPDPERSARMLSAAVKTLPALMAVWAGVRALRAGAGPDELARVLRAARGRDVRRRAPRMLPSPRRSQKR